jgi:hypothetical protein
MGSLSNLYISQSYISLLHLGSNNTASSTSTEIQDGLGNGIGLSVNTSGDLSVGGALRIGGGLTLSGSVNINTIYTSSTPSYVNSGNQFTDNIIRITGSYASGSQESPTLYEVQAGWPVYGPGLVSGAVVTNATFIPVTGWQFTINQNTAVWFGNYYFTNPNPQYINFAVSGSEDITGSLWVRDNITTNNLSASNAISASDLWIKNTIHAYKLDVTIESSSIIFTSGSNIIGDEANVDTQTLIGRVKVSGSLEVTGSTRINGNTTITGSTTISGSITASGNISSSTLSGIGNVTSYSQSVNNRVSALENFSASQYKTDSASFESQILTNSASFAAYSSSLVNTFATNAFVLAQTASLSSSIYFTDASQSARLTAIEANYATTGSNRFVGNQIITGSLIVSSSIPVDFGVIGNSTFSGSVRGVVNTLSIASNTASFDTSLGNFFILTLVSGSNTFINAINVNPGETISLLVTQPTSSYGTTTFSSNIKFPGNSPYIATPLTSSQDILTFVSYGSTLYGVAVNRMI